MRMTLEEFRKFLEIRSVEAGGDRHLADKIGVSENYVYQVKTGSRDPGPAILEPLNVSKEIRYVFTGDGQNG